MPEKESWKSCLFSVNVWSLGETHILQAVSCAWKIISPRASETPTDTVIFQVALRRDECHCIGLTQNVSGPSGLSIWRETRLLLISWAIQVLEEAAARHLSNSVSIVSSKAPQLVSLLNWKKKTLLTSQEVDSLPGGCISPSVYHTTAHYPPRSSTPHRHPPSLLW